MSLLSRSFFKDLVITYSAESFVLASGILTPALFSRLAGLEQLGIYLLLRRVIAAMVHPMTLGVAVSMARFLPQQRWQPAICARWAMLALGIAATSTVLVLTVMTRWRDAAAKLIFADVRLEHLIWPLALMLLTNVFHVVIYGYYRGTMKMGLANTLQALNSGLIPLAALLLLKRYGLSATLYATGAVMLLTEAIFLVPLLNNFIRESGEDHSGWFSKAFKEILSYGIGRVPSSLLAAALFTIAAVRLTHKVPLSEVALFILGLNVLRLGEAAIGPLGILLLPRVSDAQTNNTYDGVLRDLQLLLGATVTIAVFVGGQAIVLNDVLLKLWLGSIPALHWQIFVPLLAALPFYMTYELLRHTIDAASAMPYNSIALGVSVALLALGSLTSGTRTIIAAQVAAFLILGVLTVLVWFRLYSLKPARLTLFVIPLLFSLFSIPWTLVIRSQFHLGIRTLLANEAVLLLLLLAFLLRSRRAIQGVYKESNSLSRVIPTDAYASTTASSMD